MEGKHEWQVSMILHWPQNLSISVANQYKFEFFFLEIYIVSQVSVSRYTCVSVPICIVAS